MKYSIVSAALLLAVSASASAGHMDKSADYYAWMSLKGVVPEKCMVDLKNTDQLQDLNLVENKKYKVKVGLWCNTNTPQAMVMVDSYNGGLIDTETGKLIKYQVKFGNKEQTYDPGQKRMLLRNFKVNNNNKGIVERKTLTINPEITGWETAGNYADDLVVALYAQ